MMSINCNRPSIPSAVVPPARGRWGGRGVRGGGRQEGRRGRGVGGGGRQEGKGRERREDGGLKLKLMSKRKLGVGLATAIETIDRRHNNIIASMSMP